jgi:hypothetical protein
MNGIPELPRSDVELSGIEWLPNCGLRLSLILPDQQIVQLICSWIAQLRINLDFGRNSGKTLTWDIEYTKRAESWHVLMDFADEGVIEFDCNEIRLQDSSNRLFNI